MLSKDEYSVLKKFESVEALDVGLISATTLVTLEDKKYIEVHECGSSEYLGFVQILPKSYQITTAGRDALLEFEQRLKDHSDKKRDKKLDRIFQVFLVIVGFILGLVTEHFSAVCGTIIALFGKL